MADAAQVRRRKLVIEFMIKRVEVELRISWKKVAELARVSEPLIRRFKNNPTKHGLSPSTAAGLDVALQLEPGSIQAMLDGTGEPVRRPGSPAGVEFDPDAPASMMEIMRRWTRRLNAEDAVQLAEDLLAVRLASHKQGYDLGFDDGRAAARREA